MVRPPANQKETIMIIGNNFKKMEDGSFTGVIRTLTLNLAVVFEPNTTKRGEKAPDYRITTEDRAELGGGWKETSNGGNTYLSVRLEDPALPASIFCALVKTGVEHGYSLVWERKRKTRTGEQPGQF
jgi:uncharacterized protein (DUF736 family)